MPWLLACVGFDNIPEKPEGQGYDPEDSATRTTTETGTTTTEDGNHAPVADAGDDREGEVGVVVDFDGSGSSDPDGDALSFAWTIRSRPGGSLAELGDPADESPSFVPDLSGSWTFELVVDDGELESEPDYVELQVGASGGTPDADAGSDQVATVGDTVYLDGTGSSDPDGDPLSYSWTMTSKPGGSTTVLNGATSPTPRFVADVSGSFELELTVDDGSQSATDSVSVRAQEESDTGSGCSCRTTSPGDVLVGVLTALWFWRPRKRG